MVICFVYGCKHRSDKNSCHFFRFPAKKQSSWGRMCWRSDRQPTTQNDRICSCHFKDGNKDDDPTIFPHSNEEPLDSRDSGAKRKRKLPPVPEPEILQPVPEAPRAKRKRKSQPVPEPEIRQSQLNPKPKIAVRVGGTERCAAPCASKVFSEHTYTTVCSEKCSATMQQLKTKVKKLEADLAKWARYKPMHFDDIKHRDDKVLLYTSLPVDVFILLVAMLKRFKLKYYADWTPTMPMQDQLLMTLMKLVLNLRDADLEHRFAVNQATISNIFQTLIHALHETLFERISQNNFSSQLKSEGSVPKAVQELSSTTASKAAVDMEQDVSSILKAQQLGYKSKRTVKRSRVLKESSDGDSIVINKRFMTRDQIPAGVHVNIPPSLSNQSAFTREETELYGKLLKASVHVDTGYKRIQNFDILHHIPDNYRNLSTKIVQVCCCLVNF